MRFAYLRTPVLIILATALLLAARCGNQIKLSPEDLYHSIDRAFISGNLAEAEAQGRLLPANFGQSDLYWEEKLRLERAKVFLYEGRQDALTLLLLPLSGKPPNPALEITRSSLLSIAYARAGDLQRADQTLSQVEKRCTSELACSEIRLSQGVVELEKGNFPNAQHAFELCLASSLTRQDHFQQSQSLMNLGVVAERMEHYDEALERFHQASAVAARGGVGLALEKATGGAGWAFYKLGDYRHALQESRLAERQAALLGAQIDQVEWLNNAGLSQFRLGDFKAARESYEQSYRLAQSLKNEEEIGDSLLALAYLSLATGDLGDALNKSHEVQRIAAQKGDPDDALEPTLIEGLALAKQGQASAARVKLLTLERTTGSAASVRWEAENALAKLSADAGDRGAADTWFQRAIATFRLQRSSLSNIDSRLPFFENGSTLYLDYMEHLIREDKTDAALGVLDQSRAETLAEGLGVARDPRDRRMAENPQMVGRRLGGTILVYCLRPGTSYLWAIGPAHTGFFRLPGREVILPLVAAHTQAVLGSKDILAQQNAPGLTLYRDLIEPARSLLTPGGKVFIIADETLSSLNFETLLVRDADASDAHYWIEDADIINARSISLLAAIRKGRPAGQGPARLLMVGDPVYTRPEDVKLAHAAEEDTRVSQHFAPDQRLVLTGSQATPDAYQKSHPESYAYIHFVAHATASEINPLDSSVILSAAPGQEGAYKLYARSILDQRLRAELVTISACYGSGVRAYSGEGLVGLAWAFLHSGSHNVIGALWEVSDASTPQLMGDLYDGLAKGNPPEEALRSAKLAMIHGGGVFRKPFYWAAFQLYSGS